MILLGFSATFYLQKMMTLAESEISAPRDFGEEKGAGVSRNTKEFNFHFM